MKLTEEQIQELREIRDRCKRVYTRIYISDSKHFKPGAFYDDCISLSFLVNNRESVRIDDNDLNDGDVNLSKKEKRRQLLRSDPVSEIYHPRTYNKKQLKDLYQIFTSLKRALDRKQDVEDARYVERDSYYGKCHVSCVSNFSETSAIGKAGHTDGTFYYAHDRFFWLAGDKKYIIDGYYNSEDEWKGKNVHKIAFDFMYDRYGNFVKVGVREMRRKTVFRTKYYKKSRYVKDYDYEAEHFPEPLGDGEM